MTIHGKISKAMVHQILLAALACGLIFFAWRLTSASRTLPVSTPQAAGLRWQECELPNSEGGGVQAQACFGESEGGWVEKELASYGKQIDMFDFRLEIGADVYQTKYSGKLLWYEKYVLFKNQQEIPGSLMLGQFLAHSPNHGLANIGGKVAWEFGNTQYGFIFYDTKNIVRTYGLESAYRPYSLNGKMIFIAKRSGKFFVVYDGKKISKEFDAVLLAYCCETALYAPHGRNGVYLFNGRRNGKNILVRITAEGGMRAGRAARPGRGGRERRGAGKARR